MKDITDVKLQTLLGVQSRMYLGKEKGRGCPYVSQSFSAPISPLFHFFLPQLLGKMLWELRAISVISPGARLVCLSVECRVEIPVTFSHVSVVHLTRIDWEISLLSKTELLHCCQCSQGGLGKL